MGTTAGGLPYPDDDMPLADMAQAVQDLAEGHSPMMRRGIPGTALPTIPNNGAAGSNLVWPTLLDSDGPAGAVPTYAVTGSDGQITITRAGRYDIEAGIRYNANATGRRALTLYRNGLELRAAETAASAAALVFLPLTVLGVDLAAGDVLKLIPFQSSGAGLALVGNEASNYFSVVHR